MSGAARKLSEAAVLITGGGAGVGLAAAHSFVTAGARVLLVGRSADKLARAQETLGDTLIFAADITDPETSRRAFAFAEKNFGRPIDILVNNAGSILRKTAAQTSDAEWADIMNVNLTGLFYMSREAANRMQDGGAIINVSSTCGAVGAAGLAAYCVSKGGVDQLTRTMALELASREITVNAVAPGAINSPMLFSNHESPADARSAARRNAASIPAGRIAEPEEIARAILFLARECHMTGAILRIDGGFTAQ